MTQQRYSLNKSTPVHIVTANGEYVMDGDTPKAFTGTAYPDPSNTYLLDEEGNFLLCDGDYLRISDGTPVSAEPSAEDTNTKEEAVEEAGTKETEAVETKAEQKPAAPEEVEEEVAPTQVEMPPAPKKNTLDQTSTPEEPALEAPPAPQPTNFTQNSSATQAIPISAPHLSYAPPSIPAEPENQAPPAMASSAPLINPSITYITNSSPKKAGTPLPLAIVIMLFAAAAGAGLGWLLFSAL